MMAAEEIMNVNINILAATPQKAVGITIVVVALLAWVVYLITENRRTPKSNIESFLGAPNRKAPPEDDEYEGPRLDRFLGWALIGIAIMAVSLPAYFLAEPGREVGAIRGFDKRSVHRGEQSFGIEHNGFNCAKCHGADGGGGVTSWSVAQYNADGTPKIDPTLNKQELKQVTWAAPRINNVALRYRREQIRNVLVYGRGTNKPMPAWGVKGGGPANDQQIDDLVNYLRFAALEKDEAAVKVYNDAWNTNGHDADKAFDKAFEAAAEQSRKESVDALAKQKKEAADLVKASTDPVSPFATAMKALVDAKAKKDPGPIAAAEATLAEATLNLDNAKKVLAASDGELLFNSNCARCHTNGYSYKEPKASGGGFYGPRLSEASLSQQFPEKAAQIDYTKNGVEDSKAYGTGGVNHWSGGGMPYFGVVLTDDQIAKIVDYERSL
jgi:mono/diheme cytochrome c family protein